MKGRRRLRDLALAIAAVLLVGLLVDGFLVEPNRLILKRLTLSCAGLRSRPVRLLLVSDVDFLRVGRRERAIREAAGAFDPDLVLVAGDLIERAWAVGRPEVLEEAARYLASLPARHGRFTVPGEEESVVVDRIREAWSESGIEVLSNESRSLVIRGERLDLFGAHPEDNPAPWGTGTEANRTFLRSRGRRVLQWLIYRGEGAAAWGDVEITFAFHTSNPDSLLELRFGWQEGPSPRGGNGWRIARPESRRDFMLYANSSGKDHLSGRLASGFIPPPGVWCRTRVVLTDDGRRSRVRARFWREPDREPASWSIDAEDSSTDRHRQGSVGFGGRGGNRRYADLRVVTTDGRLLLEEDFRDPVRLRTVWHSPSALADWVFRKDTSLSARILLAHNPDIVLDLCELDAAPPCVVLAGHTHGGQVRIPGFGALYTETHIGRRYDSGLFDYMGFPLYITSGVGTSLVPIRLFDPPEVVLLTLEPAPSPG